MTEEEKIQGYYRQALSDARRSLSSVSFNLGRAVGYRLQLSGHTKPVAMLQRVAEAVSTLIEVLDTLYDHADKASTLEDSALGAEDSLEASDTRAPIEDSGGEGSWIV